MKPLLAALLLSSAALAHAQSLQQALEDYDQGRTAAAARGFTALAKQGDALAQFNLAMMHLRRELPKASDTQAWTLLSRAAAQGSRLAEHALGQMIEQGRHGRPDAKAACDWFERSAEHGLGDGALEAATCYYLGRGRPQDMAQAQRWYLEAAKSGDVGAQYIVATMFEKGVGVEADDRLARYWYDAAAKNGDVAARAKLNAMQAADGAT